MFASWRPFCGIIYTHLKVERTDQKCVQEYKHHVTKSCLELRWRVGICLAWAVGLKSCDTITRESRQDDETFYDHKCRNLQGLPGYSSYTQYGTFVYGYCNCHARSILKLNLKHAVTSLYRIIVDDLNIKFDVICNNLAFKPALINTQCSNKKTATFLVITSANINRFSKFFHRQIPEKPH